MKIMGLVTVALPVGPLFYRGRAMNTGPFSMFGGRAGLGRGPPRPPPSCARVAGHVLDHDDGHTVLQAAETSPNP